MHGTMVSMHGRRLLNIETATSDPSKNIINRERKRVDRQTPRRARTQRKLKEKKRKQQRSITCLLDTYRVLLYFCYRRTWYFIIVIIIIIHHPQGITDTEIISPVQLQMIPPCQGRRDPNIKWKGTDPKGYKLLETSMTLPRSGHVGVANAPRYVAFLSFPRCWRVVAACVLSSRRGDIDVTRDDVVAAALFVDREMQTVRSRGGAVLPGLPTPVAGITPGAAGGWGRYGVPPRLVHSCRFFIFIYWTWAISLHFCCTSDSLQLGSWTRDARANSMTITSFLLWEAERKDRAGDQD